MFGVVGFLAIVGALAEVFDGGSDNTVVEPDPPVEPDVNEVSGTNGADILQGTIGMDLIEGNNGDDTISGLAGDDLLAGGQGLDTIRGGEGDDIILGGVGSDTIEGGTGQDLIDGGGNSDDIRGGADADLIGGGNGGDTIQGDGGNDVLFGEAGADLVAGGAGDDYVFGGEGNDDLRGGEGGDIMSGDLGVDQLSGGQGDDLLFGLFDPAIAFGTVDFDEGDVLLGNEGDDFFYIGSGDSATGGAGADTFGSGTFVRPGEAGVVTDFDPAEDMIQLHYDGAAGPAPTVAVVANPDGSASILMDGQIVLNVTTPGGLSAGDIALVDTLVLSPANTGIPAPAFPDETAPDVKDVQVAAASGTQDEIAA